jgi:hypothetical protein
VEFLGFGCLWFSFIFAASKQILETSIFFQDVKSSITVVLFLCFILELSQHQLGNGLAISLDLLGDHMLLLRVLIHSCTSDVHL